MNEQLDNLVDSAVKLVNNAVKLERWIILEEINKTMDKGNVVGGGFNAALCLSKVKKYLETGRWNNE